MFRRFHRKGILDIVYAREGSDIEYLLLHRFDPWKGWEHVKGGVKRGESEKDAVKRELYGETHLKSIKIQKIPYKVIYRFPRKLRYAGGKCIGQNLQVYAVEVNSEDKDKTRVNFKEHDDHKWVNRQQAKEMLRHKKHKRALEIVDERIINLMKKKKRRFIKL